MEISYDGISEDEISMDEISSQRRKTKFRYRNAKIASKFRIRIQNFVYEMSISYTKSMVGDEISSPKCLRNRSLANFRRGGVTF